VVKNVYKIIAKCFSNYYCQTSLLRFKKKSEI